MFAKAEMYRPGGSIGNVGAARSLLGFGPDPDDPDGADGRRRLLGHLKSNWGQKAPTLLYEMRSVAVESVDGPIGTNLLALVGETERPAAEAFGAHQTEDRGADAEEAIGWTLAGGRRPSRDVKTEVMSELKCSASTVERAAKRMADRAELLIASHGWPRRTWWELSPPGDRSESSADGPGSGETVASPPIRPDDVTVEVGSTKRDATAATAPQFPVTSRNGDDAIDDVTAVETLDELISHDGLDELAAACNAVELDQSRIERDDTGAIVSLHGQPMDRSDTPATHRLLAPADAAALLARCELRAAGVRESTFEVQRRSGFWRPLVEMPAADETWYVTPATAAALTGLRTSTLATMRTRGELQSIGMTAGEYKRARKLAGWEDQDVGWGPRVFYLRAGIEPAAGYP